MESRTGCTLDTFLVEPGTGDGPRAPWVIRTGLERLLKALVGALAARLASDDAPPPGLTGQLRLGLENPVLGRLQELLFWLARNDTAASTARLRGFLARETKEPWLLALVSSRNRWFHPRGDEPAAVEKEVERLLGRAGELAALGRIEEREAGILAWSAPEGLHALHPFFWLLDGTVQTFSELKAPGQLVTDGALAPVQHDFARVWRRLRAGDTALDRPSPAEFDERVRRLELPNGAGPVPWVREALRPGPFALLVEPEAIGSVCHAVAEGWKGARVLPLELEEGEVPVDPIARRLSLGAAPTREELARLVSAKAPLALVVDAGRLSARSFARLLYWLADVHDSRPTDLRVFVSRGRSQLAADTEALRDRLPDGIDAILRYPPGPEPRTLDDLLFGAASSASRRGRDR